ncbi:MAG: hypothetical protein AABY30_06585 [Candidatus Thermoplasmatota archaeon]
MGWFRRAFKPRTFAPAAYPFSGEVRMRHEDYERLGTGWWKIAVQSAEEWGAKLAEMREGIRSHYGQYVTKDGRLVPRWNDETWALVEPGLVVESR